MLAIEISDLKKIYAGGQQALKGITFSVREGDFFALLGPNGAGKSTTIGIITSLVNKTQGTVKIFGHDIEKETQLAKRCIGLVPQEFNCSVFETVLQVVVTQAGYYGVSRTLALTRAEYYLKKIGLWEKRNTQVRTLSGGMKRRLMIARALLHEPRLLILDEPTAGVDIELRRAMWDFLEEINQKGITVILTTHYLEEAERMCRHVAIIDQGHIIENSSTKALLKKLNTETFIFYLQKPIAILPNMVGFDYKLIDETTLEIEVSHEQTLSYIFEQFQKNGMIVSSMRNKTNRLEELFIKLTKERRENDQ